VSVAAEFDVELSDHIAHQVTAPDIDWADVVVALDPENRLRLDSRFGALLAAKRTVLLGAFLSPPRETIEDPYSQPRDQFRDSYRQICEAVESLSRTVRTDAAM
jgi:protein-tyrosine-phosphatase